MEANAYESAAPPPYVKLVNEPVDPRTPQTQQQQQSVVVVNASQPFVYQAAPLPQSFTGHIVLSCIVFWCCGIVLGVVAFILAVLAQSYSTSLNIKDRETARQLGKASIIFSVLGMVIGVILIVLIVSLSVNGAAVGSAIAVVTECPYNINGECFKHMTRMSIFECTLKFPSEYSGNYCYYN